MKKLKIAYRSGTTVTIEYDEAIEDNLFIVLYKLVNISDTEFVNHDRLYEKLFMMGIYVDPGQVDMLQVLK